MDELIGVLTESETLTGQIDVGVVHDGGSTTSVASWNTRTGNVMPQQDDYTLGMVGGVPLTNSDIDDLWNSL